MPKGGTLKIKNNSLIQINTLWGCENVKDFYYLDGYNVVNINTGHMKTISKLNGKRGYPYVTLETKLGNNKKCLMHHLIALAYIDNKPYEIIEHLDDDADNYNIENLMFSNQAQNVKRAFENGRPNRIEKTFELVLQTGEKFVGTIKELAEKTKIPKSSIYMVYYRQSPGRKIKNITLKSGQQTIEQIPNV